MLFVLSTCVVKGGGIKMTHIEIEEWLHTDLCRLKTKAREYWNRDQRLKPNKGKVSMQEVISYLYFKKSL